MQAQAGSGSNFDYIINAGGTTITLTNYTATNKVVIIPTNINGLLVVNIGDNTFNDDSVVSVTIPNSVTNIGNGAFLNNNSLTNISFGTNVNNIGSDAFENDNSLTNVTIPNSVINIGDYAFENDNNLTNVTIGTNVATPSETTCLSKLQQPDQRYNSRQRHHSSERRPWIIVPA